MAKKILYATCGLGEVSVEQLIASLFAVDSEGTTYIRTVSTTVDCDDLTSIPACDDGQVDFIQLLKKVVVIDPCSSKPALNLALCSCQ